MLRQLLILGFVLIFCSIVRAEGRNEQSILPKPGGPFAIGTMKVFVTDSSRMETFITKKKFREIYIKIRSEEHTSELQSRENLVCRLLLEKKKTNKKTVIIIKHIADLERV